MFTLLKVSLELADATVNEKRSLKHLAPYQIHNTFHRRRCVYTSDYQGSSDSFRHADINHQRITNYLWLLFEQTRTKKYTRIKKRKLYGEAKRVEKFVCGRNRNKTIVTSEW